MPFFWTPQSDPKIIVLMCTMGLFSGITGLAILGGIASVISLLCFAGAILGAMLSR